MNKKLDYEALVQIWGVYPFYKSQHHPLHQ